MYISEHANVNTKSQRLPFPSFHYVNADWDEVLSFHQKKERDVKPYKINQSNFWYAVTCKIKKKISDSIFSTTALVKRNEAFLKFDIDGQYLRNDSNVVTNYKIFKQWILIFWNKTKCEYNWLESIYKCVISAKWIT
jgi:hypothetical protein